MTSKEKIIARLNKGFDLNIGSGNTLRTHGNPFGRCNWSWMFLYPVFGNNFSGTIGSYIPIGKLLKSKRLALTHDNAGDWNVYPCDAGYNFEREERNNDIIYENV